MLTVLFYSLAEVHYILSSAILLSTFRKVSYCGFRRDTKEPVFTSNSVSPHSQGEVRAMGFGRGCEQSVLYLAESVRPHHSTEGGYMF